MINSFVACTYKYSKYQSIFIPDIMMTHTYSDFNIQHVIY